mgnify:CR=1 FL=1
MSKDKKNILLGVFVAEVLVAVIFVYFHYFSLDKLKDTELINSALIQNRTAILKDFLSSPGFQALEDFGKLPINIGTTGNKNPF